MRSAATFALALLAIGCRREPEMNSCRDSLGGQWQVVTGEHRGESWALLDRGTAIEMYPLFDLTKTTSPMLAAQPMINARRVSEHPAELVGRSSWRFTLGGTSCVYHQYFAIDSCRNDELHVEMPTWAPPPDPSQCPTADDADVHLALTMRRIAPLH